MNIFVNNKSIETSAIFLSELIVQIPDYGINSAISLNGQIIHEIDFQTTKLHESDKIEIISALAGG